MREYLELQYRMTNRKFKDNGFEPIFAYIILTVVFFGLSIYLFFKTEFAQYAYLLFALTLIGKLSEIRRTEFLKICFGEVKLRKIRITENVICSIPFVIFLLYKQLFYFVPLLLALSTILSFNLFKTTINLTIWTPFSKRPFEFTTGFRNTFYLFFIAYTLTGIAVFVNNFNLGIFAMILVFATTLGYYTKPENEYFVWTFNVKAKEFLFRKIKTALLYSTLLILPIIIALTISNPQYIGLLSIFYVLGCAFLICFIVLKYSAFPNEMNITQAITISLCVWFPPLLFILVPYLFKKSETHLAKLLK